MFGFEASRQLGEPDEIWRTAALAIHRDDRRQRSRPPERRSEFLRHDLETHGTLSPSEGALFNRTLEELGGERLDVMQFGQRWHPHRLPDSEILSRVARASRAVADKRWSDTDEELYARALATLPDGSRKSFDADRDYLARIVERARRLTEA